MSDKDTCIYEFAGSGNPFEGAWRLYRGADGAHFIEAVYGSEDDPEGIRDVQPWDQYKVYRYDLPDDVCKDIDWAGPFDAVTQAEGRNPDPKKRADVVADVASTHGWHELDQYPLHLSAQELEARWGLDEGFSDEALAFEHDVSLQDASVLTPVLAVYLALTHVEVAGLAFDEVLAEAKKLRAWTKNGERKSE